MTRETFNTIKARLNLNNIDKSSSSYKSIAWNTRGWQHRYEYDFDRILDDILFNGNLRKTVKEVEQTIQILLAENVFSEDQWDMIISYLDAEEFWADVKVLDKKVLPLFNKIIDFKDSLSLEFWQGAFSKDHKADWVDADEINTPENGRLYCTTIKKIKPYLTEFYNKWPDSEETLSERYS